MHLRNCNKQCNLKYKITCMKQAMSDLITNEKQHSKKQLTVTCSKSEVERDQQKWPMAHDNHKNYNYSLCYDLKSSQVCNLIFDLFEIRVLISLSYLSS